MKKLAIVSSVLAIGMFAILAVNALQQWGDRVSAAGNSSGQAAPSALQASELLTTGNFLLEIGGIDVPTGDWWFVDGVAINMDVIAIRDGGGGRESKAPGDTHYAEEGITVRGPFLESRQELRDWFNLWASGDEAASRTSGSLILLTRDGKEVFRLNLFEMWPSNYRLSSLGASQVLGCSNCPEQILQEEFVFQVEWINEG